MGLIKGIDIILIDKIQKGVDGFGSPIFDEVEKTIKNVLVAPATTDDVVNSVNLTGKKAVYVIGIPRGDRNVWENKEVRFFGERWKTIGIAQQGIDSMIPLDWTRKIMVERYA